MDAKGTLGIVVTHPVRNVCGEIVHWTSACVFQFTDQEQVRDLLGNETAAVWSDIRRTGSYSAITGRPFWPLWLGTEGEVGTTPECDTTADLQWIA